MDEPREVDAELVKKYYRRRYGKEKRLRSGTSEYKRYHRELARTVDCHCILRDSACKHHHLGTTGQRCGRISELKSIYCLHCAQVNLQKTAHVVHSSTATTEYYAAAVANEQMQRNQKRKYTDDTTTPKIENNNLPVISPAADRPNPGHPNYLDWEKQQLLSSSVLRSKTNYILQQQTTGPPALVHHQDLIQNKTPLNIHYQQPPFPPSSGVLPVAAVVPAASTATPPHLAVNSLSQQKQLQYNFTSQFQQLLLFTLRSLEERVFILEQKLLNKDAIAAGTITTSSMPPLPSSSPTTITSNHILPPPSQSSLPTSIEHNQQVLSSLLSMYAMQQHHNEFSARTNTATTPPPPPSSASYPPPAAQNESGDDGDANSSTSVFIL